MMRPPQQPRTQERLESFPVYQAARKLFDDFWTDSELMGKDHRGQELSQLQLRSLDSICANMELGFGRGFTEELPRYLQIACGNAIESRGRYGRCGHLLPADVLKQRLAALDQIISSLAEAVKTVEAKQKQGSPSAISRHLPPDTAQ